MVYSLRRAYRAPLVVSAALGLLIILAIVLLQGFTRDNYIIVGSVIILHDMGYTPDLIEGFKKHSGVDVKAIIRGTGDLMRLLSDGTICVALTGSPHLEFKYSSEGRVEWLGVFAYGYFVIAGPPEDPAGVSGASNMLDAFTRIYRAGEEGKIKFVSRGDLSGTHVREMQIWNLTGLNPGGKPWYVRTAQGPVQTALMADNLNAYLLMDGGTYKSLESQGKIRNLRIHYVNTSEFLSLFTWSIVASKHEACKGLKGFISEFRDYVMGPGQELIEEKYSPQGLLYPAKGREDLKSVWESLAKLGG